MKSQGDRLWDRRRGPEGARRGGPGRGPQPQELQPRNTSPAGSATPARTQKAARTPRRFARDPRGGRCPGEGGRGSPAVSREGVGAVGRAVGTQAGRRGRQSAAVRAERSRRLPCVPSVQVQRSGLWAGSQTGCEATSSRPPAVPDATRTGFRTRRKCRGKNQVPAPRLLGGPCRRHKGLKQRLAPLFRRTRGKGWGQGASRVRLLSPAPCAHPSCLTPGSAREGRWSGPRPP